MVAIVHSLGNTEKLDAILVAAQKRLGHYGFEKTTMSEIAADVNMSKASLYYYFPDKESLWTAVLAKEHNEYLGLVASRMKEITDPEQMIMEFVMMRHDYFTTFLNLTKFRFSDFYQIRPHFREMIGVLRQQERAQVTQILEKGQASGVFGIQNPEEQAHLFMDILNGLRLLVIRNRPVTDLAREDYDLMISNHCSFCKMFIRSMKNNTAIS